MTLKGMNLKTLDVHEMYAINGGGLFDVVPTWLKKLTPAAAAVYIIDHWEEVKAGLSDGWNLK